MTSTIGRKKKNYRIAGNYVILILLSLIILVPLFWMVSTALKPMAEIYTREQTLFPIHPTVDPFKKFWGIYNFGQMTINSLIVVSSAVAICVIFSCLAGYGVTRFNFPGKKSFMSFLLMTKMFPGVMLIVPYYAMIKTYGLVNTRASLVVVYAASHIAFSTWMMSSFFKSIPIELDEAALIDGANRFQTFRKIILPLTVPGIASVSIYSFIYSWNDFLFANTLISADRLKTLTVGIVALNSQYQVYWNDMMAASLFSSLPLIVLFVCFQKYFIAGMTSGAVKS